MDYRLLVSQISSRKLSLLSDEIARELLRRTDVKININEITKKTLSMKNENLPPYVNEIHDLFLRYGPCTCSNSMIDETIIIDYDDARDCSDVLRETNGILDFTDILNISLL
jgi:hypothetical protein